MLLKIEPFFGILEIAPQTLPLIIKTLFDLSGINLAKFFWKELKA